MKTNKLFLGLFAGALLCFSNASYAQHGGGSDGAFGSGSNSVDLGVGFISGVNTLYTGSSVSQSPAYELSYEHGLSSNWGIGIFISDQSSTATDSYQDYNFTNGTIGNYSDVYKTSLLLINLRGAYHFSAGSKLDPYIGAQLGYTTMSFSFSSDDPNFSAFASSLSFPTASGIDFGAYAGVKYYFSSHIGVWAELQYAAASYKITVAGGGTSASESESINAATLANLGICFKF